MDCPRGNYPGMDALSHFSYYGLLGYNFGINRVEYQVNLDTRILSPLIVKLNAMNYNHVNELNLNLSYPFINNRTEGFNSLTGTYNLSLMDLSIWKMQANLSTGFSYPKTNLVFDVSGILQEDNKGYKLDANIDKYFLEGNLSLNIGLAGYADPISSVGLIRAYNQSMEYSQAEIFSLEYTRNLLKIEKGLWNPSIYFHDLYGKLFLDGMRLDQERLIILTVLNSI